MNQNKSRQRNIKLIQVALEIKQKYQIIEQADKSNCKAIKNAQLSSNKLQKTNINLEKLIINENDSNSAPVKRMGFHRLKEISLKEPAEILITLNCPRSGFKELLKENTISYDMMTIIVRVLGKASKATELLNLSSLINDVVSETSFISQHLQCYLIRLSNQNIDSINNILIFLLKFQELQPVTASEILSCVIPTLQNTLERIQKRGISIPSIIQNNMKLLQMKKETVIEEYDEKSRFKLSKHEKLQSQKPPEDYKTIPIFPSKEDFINKRPFLRPNIVQGSYFNTNHYLDVQFRLLREDYVRPLRENVEKYKISLNNSKKSEKKFRIYSDVRVLCPYNTESGIVHLISFDVKSFSKINWEVSKRLLPGSLLCLSSDNFETMQFATVANRNPSKLREGQLEVYFEKLDKNIFSISSSEIFIMVESEAYFEAFRHTLLALQQTKDNEVPLQQYIVHVQKKVNAPKYLNSTTKYNFSLTFRDLPSMNNEYMVPVLNTNLWPSEKHLGLDYSQYSAIQAALTNEFAIIQGPPGTGKTFIGLKITQLLLENSTIWNDNSPILVVCYTNHALDQFLEGILLFEENIIRIGGRSNNERIKKLQLSQFRQAARANREIPKHIYLLRKAIMKKIDVLESYSESYFHSLEFSTKEILSLELLKPVIERRHIKFLQNGPVPSLRKLYSISDWLNISYETILENFDLENEENESNASEKDINIEDEEDIEFELGLREIDEFEFRHIKTSITNDPYLFQRNKKTDQRRKKYITKMLNNQDIMSNSEAKHIGNVWKLKIEDRWRLYRLWIAKYISYMIDSFSDLQNLYHEQLEKLKELRTLEDKFLLHRAKIIGMTTTGAGKYRELLQELQPRIVIVEEAAEVLEAHIVTSLAAQTQHLILIGDHQQLRPSPTVYELAVHYLMDISLFERMIKNGMTCYQLKLQHRMRPCISRLLVSTIYPDLQNHPSVEKYKNVLGVKSNMFFVNHCFQESDVSDTKSHSNLHEARFLVELCIFFKKQGYESSQITVLTTYSGQLFALKRLMKENKLLEGIRVTVVDNFQGEENDIILVSFVRSNDEGSIGFLKVSNRVCVALSRAKEGLFCIGNFDLLAEKSDLWKNITKELENQNAIGSALALCCQNHPKNIAKVSTAEDFKKNVPDGGCTKLCNFRMECGHSCIRMCHPYDREHTEIECRKPCNKLLCDLGHKCPKLCFESCGKCTVPIKKIIPSCQHENLVPCHLEAKDFPCKEICNKILDCGHICSKLCHQPCKPCKTKIEKAFGCGHKISLYCHENDSIIVCNKLCYKYLPCGHKCNKNCGIIPCPPCEALIKISLPCNHLVEIKCSENSFKSIHCEQGCAKKMACDHECKLICGHEGNCGPCDEICKNILICGHCCGLKCGEICPNLCKICKSISVINEAYLDFNKNKFLFQEIDSDSDYDIYDDSSDSDGFLSC